MFKSKNLNLGYLLLILVIFGIVMNASVVKAEEEEVVLNVKGMTCGKCENAVKAALLECEGVKDAKVSHKEANAVVKVDADKADIDKLIKAVEKTGKFSAEKS